MPISQISLELCDVLNQRDEIAFKVATLYLERHSLPYLKDRLLYELSTDFGAIRPLRETWIALLNLDSLGFVEFYERVYRFRKAPHYENLFMTVFLSFVASLAANILYDDFKEWRKNSPRLEILQRFGNSALCLLEYLINAIAMMEAYYFGRIPSNNLEEYRKVLKNATFGQNERSTPEMESTYILNEFFEKHGINSIGEIEIDINQIILENIKSIDHIKEEDKKPEKLDPCILIGVPLAPGIASGVITVVESLEDAKRIQDGDIGLFCYFSPDMVPGLKKCAGMINKGASAHKTSHGTIVYRALGIPSVGFDGDQLHQGQVAQIDGNSGTIKIASGTSDLRKMLFKLG